MAGELALIETAADIPCDFVGEALTFQVLESAGEGELFTYRAVPGEVHTVTPAAQSTADLHPYSVGLGQVSLSVRRIWMNCRFPP